MPDRHHCIPCARCGSNAGCPEGDGRLCDCGNALCVGCPCPDDCEAEALAATEAGA